MLFISKLEEVNYVTYFKNSSWPIWVFDTFSEHCTSKIILSNNKRTVKTDTNE